MTNSSMANPYFATMAYHRNEHNYPGVGCFKIHFSPLIKAIVFSSVPLGMLMVMEFCDTVMEKSWNFVAHINTHILG